ncbi:MAG: hypothetical protein A2402_02515 [Candidatus Staskawiczbacteria bacterium RIFOXYC1_FULL_37_43]|nr:MAG: hypothetical protein A2813_03855 [Candidatus Staskawiczbacteria bacterium RIFCSPHIGHO2_01_FULL_37_17]OGZ71892.1 MAG: hypothetical protein A2891_00565 [Candidatus Staskawiczbacteria bacterium RIFCSPLOWO2_01_FULL_37_19]OGZ75852.1 MAG: hypothetical protein A2205_02040 [Candidatus Staskawiczbacteria bacterium RIFOXYA1_FULL_37_15]OGZ77505.1 MAG: hypothetical protein A2280_03485 [Candidatus Staskawiczbacteria bacterium RIFOXYA12_FULL_37_10]OGZ80222.1 MAG: hypothetical protein A2353_04110 [Can
MQKETREKIKQLVEKYESEKSSGKIKSYSEEETKRGFIEPLFEALGWDFSDKKEISMEESISSQRVDYGFYLNDRIKFYLEAKPLRADLHKIEYADQAVRYSWNKGATWAVLTDFESIKVFNAQDISRSLADKLFFEISYQDYLNRFDQLWLLSKEAFKDDLLDKEAERVGKKFQKIPITSLLYKDLQKCREILIKNLSQWNRDVKSDDLDEGVQKILDRLLFIRVAEDRGVEQPTLRPMVREYLSRKEQKGTLYGMMIEKFRELDKYYNSNLFSEHPFEKWEEYSGATKDVIGILYGKESYYEYDFKAMPSDVLGAVYENYLSHRLSKSKKGTTVSKDASKRKEQGIYYTPNYIVDYIVKNALGPILEKCKSVQELKKIKVLDPACGSGSFLIKAVDVIAEKYKSFGYREEELLKRQIIDENIYGVDLDSQAVEITRLNLLINALTQREKFLPLKNIRNGNSLTFDWQENFSEVFKQSGFDVIIGNPPYIKEFVSKSAFDELHNSPYYQGKMDIWTMFACISIDLLKEYGLLGFIAPNSWVTNAGASIFRDKVLKDGELKTFIDFGDYKVFEQAGIQTMIFVFEKKKPGKNYKVDYLKIIDKNITEDKLIVNIFGTKIKTNIEPESLIGKNITFENTKVASILSKILKKKNFEILDDEISNGIHHHHDSVNRERREILGNNFSVGDGIFVISEKEKDQIKLNKKELDIIKPSYTTKELKRWYTDSNNKEWVIYTDSSFKDSDKIDSYPNIKKHLDKFKAVITSDNKPYGLHRAKKEKFFKGEKIITPRKCLNLAFSYVDFDSYVSATFYIIKTERVNQKYLTAILNSKITAFWLKNKGKMQGNNYQLDKEPLVAVPIYIGDKNQQKQIIVLVDKILKLNKDLQKATENSNKWNLIKSEIEKTDKKIDQEVYNLYGLTEEEIKIVENQ